MCVGRRDERARKFPDAGRCTAACRGRRSRQRSYFSSASSLPSSERITSRPVRGFIREASSSETGRKNGHQESPGRRASPRPRPDESLATRAHARAGRFVESAGSGLFLTLFAVVLVHVWSLKRVLDFPPLTLSQRVQGLVFALLSGFLVLYYWRALFHYLLRRSNFSERVLILGSGKAALALANEIRERPDAGYEIAGILPDASTHGESARGSSRRASDVIPSLAAVQPPLTTARPAANRRTSEGARDEP